MANILVLDDVLDAANLIRRILSLMGHDIFAFTEEAEGILEVCQIPRLVTLWLSLTGTVPQYSWLHF